MRLVGFISLFTDATSQTPPSNSNNFSNNEDKKDSPSLGAKEDGGKLANQVGGDKNLQLWAVNPEIGVPIELHSKGLWFYFSDGGGIKIYTKDLIEFLKSRMGDELNPIMEESKSGYAFYGKSYFPDNFFNKDSNSETI